MGEWEECYAQDFPGEAKQQYFWEKALMIHKKFPINPVFPDCINIKNPPSMQPVESKTKNGMGLRIFVTRLCDHEK